MNRYCLGFAFSHDFQTVLLIRKNKPDWQKGLLNGVGGKCEPNESPLSSMLREFHEEAGLETDANQWRHFCTMQRKDDFQVYCFAALIEPNSAFIMTDEILEVVKVDTINPNRADVISNLPWLVAMAKDFWISNSGFTANVAYL
jgi:8-oxo-dGTP diphosphatase